MTAVNKPEVGSTSEYSQTLGRGLGVLELLRAHPDGLSAGTISAELGLHRTVVYRLLGTLRRHGFVVQDETGRYRLGLGLLEYVNAVRTDLREAAEPWLGALADEVGATAFLTLAEQQDAVSASVRAPRRVRLHVGYRAGVRHPLTVSAAGIAILATAPAVDGERADVALARTRGYAVSHGELQAGAWGLAVGLRRECVPAGASIGVVALTELDVDEVSAAVLRSARAIESDVHH